MAAASGVGLWVAGHGARIFGEIAKDIGIEVIVGEVPVEDLYRSTEMFLTSTAGGVMPVATLDGKPVGTGQPGPVTTKIRDRYWELHTDPRYSHEVDY
jgi:branched-subunit amino acid aminotransferase/4-amino-4-deoxychorismate lyase